MERSVWTDERIDDLAARGESQFDLLRSEMREMRTEIRTEMREMRAELRDELGGEIRGVRGEVRDLRADMQAEFTSVRRDMFHGAIALFAALVAMYATMLVHALS